MSSREGLFGFITRLSRPPRFDSDADLLERFIRESNEAAFRGIVRRYGLMVLSICRQRLRREADAEDAFQAVFLALARSARVLQQHESLPGWLYRVAYLTSLKAAGIQARRPMVALPADVPQRESLASEIESAELRLQIDGELAALPAKFRAVVVLCLVEGRNNREAAAILGVPVGTVDSRLNAARKRLQARLIRRGVAVGVGATLGPTLGNTLGATEAAGLQDLMARTLTAIFAELRTPGCGAISPTVANLAQGVSMTTRLQLLATAGILLGLLGGTATGIYLAAAADPAPSTQAKPAAKSEEPQRNNSKSVNPLNKDELKNPAEVDPLQKTIKVINDAEGFVTLRDLFASIEHETGLVIRVDVASFRRLEPADWTEIVQFAPRIYEKTVTVPRRAEKVPIRDLLSDALAQLPPVANLNYTFQVRGSQLVIIPAFQPPVKPGTDVLNLVAESPFPGQEPEDLTILPTKMIWLQISGPLVNVSADKKRIGEVLDELRKQTGANIVLDPRCEDNAKRDPLTLSLNNVYLYDALRVIADLQGVKMVYTSNIYYVTNVENAKNFFPTPPLTANTPRPATKKPTPAPADSKQP